MTDPSFLVIPALDLRAGKVVRLAQGDPARQTHYGDDPLEWAERWRSEGADWLHVINLSGAFDEDASLNWHALGSLLCLGLKIEYGGGFRDRGSIERAIGMGVERVFLGTAAIQSPELVEWAVGLYGSTHIAADIGVKGGRVMVQGWQQEASLSALELGQALRRQGIRWCVLTDVSRDGTGTGANLAAATMLQQETDMQVMASGGISSTKEIQAARQAGLAGVILGKALYEGQLSLRDCLAEA
jgi:phosphoribosylformimino-5-aminoimidazole carboxamide ribotide isomerase